MASRHHAYVVSGKRTSSGLGDLSMKLAEDLRADVKTLTLGAPILSPNWTQTARVIARVASISDTERALAEEAGVESTLWEGEELALRFVLDEGKSKIVLMLLIRAKARAAEIAADQDEEESAEDCALAYFEEQAGAVVRNMLRHLVCLQTIDIEAIVQHCVSVMRLARGRASICSGARARRQETVLIDYVRSIARHVDALGDAKVMAIAKKHRLVEALVRHIDEHRESLGVAHVQLGAEALADLLDTEDFRTDHVEFLSAEEDIATIAAWDGLFLRAMSRSNRPLRKRLRGLLDFSLKCARLSRAAACSKSGK